MPRARDGPVEPLRISQRAPGWVHFPPFPVVGTPAVTTLASGALKFKHSALSRWVGDRVSTGASVLGHSRYYWVAARRIETRVMAESLRVAIRNRPTQ